jgi:hypothetical protein
MSINFNDHDLTTSGNFTANSGNFTSLTLNNTGVSVSGHTHSNITITAGSGLAGGGSLAENRTIDIGQGDGISVSADSIAVDSTVVRTTGTQTISGAKTFTAATVFSTGITISSSGTNVPLTITHDGTGNCFVVNDVTGDTSPFVIDSSGNVGIGTTTPTFVNNNYSGLHIHAATATSLKLTNTTTGQTSTDGFELLQDSAGNAYVWNRENTNISIATSGTSRITITNDGKVGIGVTPASAGSSALQVRGDLDIFGNGSDRSITYNMGVGDDGITGWYRSKIAFIPSSATNKVSQHIAFFNKDGDLGGSTLTERMRITTGGNVGIGTSSPSTTLDIQRTSSDAALFLQGQTSSTGAQVQLYSGAGLGYIGTRNNYPLVITSNNTERMRITSAGDIGIGTSSPPEKLSVFGDTNAGRTSILIDNLDQRLKMSCYYEAGVGQYAEIQSTNNAETGHQNLILNRQGGNVAIGTAAAAYLLHVVGNASTANNVVVYINNTGATRSRLAFQDTSTTYAPDISSIGNDIVFDAVGNEALRIDSDRNLRINGAAKATSAVGCVHIKNGTAPSASIIDGVVLFAADISSSSELRVRDEAGNVTTISPHSFPLIPDGPSEDMAWSYYSERDGKKINVDMLKAIRLLEKLTGEKLVYTI